MPPDETEAASSRLDDTRVLVGAVAVVVGIFAVLVAVLVDRAPTSHTKIVVAAIGLTGFLATSAITFIGVLLTHSFNQRTARLAELAEENRRLEAAKVEERAKLEASMRAVELLTNPDGSPAHRSRQAGALMALSFPPLEQVELALALLDANWREGGISATAGVEIVERGLRTPSTGTQALAALTLHRHADLVVARDGRSFEWPDTAETYPPTLTNKTRYTLLEALLKMLSAHQPGEHLNLVVINHTVLMLDEIRRLDPWETNRAGAIVGLRAVLDWYSRTDPRVTELVTPDGDVNVAELARTVASLLPSALETATHQFVVVASEIRTKWRPFTDAH